MMTLMLLVLSGTSAWVLENLRASLIERTDEQLIQASEALAVQAAETVITSGPLRATSGSPADESLRQLLPGSYYVQFYRADGTEVYEPLSPSDTNVPDLGTIDSQTVETMQGRPFTVSGTGSQWRVRALHVENSDLLIAIAVPFDQSIDAVSERAQNTIVGIGLLALALVAGVGYFAITNTFRPLKDIETTASKIAAGDLSQRVSDYPIDTELGRLSAAINTMLVHIEDSFDGRTRSEKRIRQFVSDASHELRTPLVTIRGYAELYRQGAIATPEHTAQAMERIEAEAKRMGTLVDDLVTLARMDERRPAEVTSVDIAAMVRDAAADAVAQAPDREISFVSLDGGDADPSSVPHVIGAENRLRQVIVNLSGNAVRHTPDGAAIEFAVGVLGLPEQPPEQAAEDREEKGFVTGGVKIFRRGRTADRKGAKGDGRGDGPDTGPQQQLPAADPQTGAFATAKLELGEDLTGFPHGRVRFEVRDRGEGIDPDQVPRIFERFYRLDASRTRDTGGSGLGLSIVKAIVESHQGAISVHPTPGGGATFRVDLPIPGDEAHSLSAANAHEAAAQRKDLP